MTERPIIFSAPMVRALLAGTKTQTRRVVKLPQMIEEPGDPDATRVAWLSPSNAEPGWYGWMTEYPNEGAAHIRCPYGAPGDRLWVRETWADCGDMVRYYATDDVHHLRRKRSSIHMPRWASRITLEVTAIRVERLQEISRGDAMAEGCPFPNMAKGDDPRKWYADLWDQINGSGSWEANPWVWVVDFKRIDHANQA